MKKAKKFIIFLGIFFFIILFFSYIKIFTQINIVKEFKNFPSNKTKLFIKKKIRKYIISNKSNFKFTKDISKKIENTGFNITTFKNTYLKSMGPRAYFATESENLFLATGTGKLMYRVIKSNDNNLTFQIIKTN